MNSFHARDRRAGPRAGSHPRDKEGSPPPAPKPHGEGVLRADALLVAQGAAPSRTRARQLIEAGCVTADGHAVQKPSQLLAESSRLEVRDDAQGDYVSRGALKLAAALRHSGLDVRGQHCLDIGQSTGGFSDCLLRAGAASVVGVEVGHDQLHPRLRDDPRCVTLEGINARALTADVLGTHFPAHGFDLVVCDASFISLTLLLPQWPALLAPGGHILALVKPQFEVGPENLGKGGVVRDPTLYRQVEQRMREAAAMAGLDVRGWFDSPLIGGGVGNIDGNREFLIWMQKPE